MSKRVESLAISLLQICLAEHSYDIRQPVCLATGTNDFISLECGQECFFLVSVTLEVQMFFKEFLQSFVWNEL